MHNNGNSPIMLATAEKQIFMQHKSCQIKEFLLEDSVRLIGMTMQPLTHSWMSFRILSLPITIFSLNAL